MTTRGTERTLANLPGTAKTLLATAFLVALRQTGVPSGPPAVDAYDNGLGRTPPMGWNSWNRFQCDDWNETVVLQIADALLAHGLHRVGYSYINLDDCWQRSRDRNNGGSIVEDPEKFPTGVRPFVDSIHDRGLKFGLYSDAGYRTCAGRPGSLGYETIDAETYANWTVDYLKYDNCYSNPLTVKSRYNAMHEALNSTARPIFFSMCEWGVQNPAIWARNVGNSWRTTGDIAPTWKSWTSILDKNDAWHAYAGPGGWNDPDMLEVGNGELDDEHLTEARSHFTLWCLVKAPLLLGNDLRVVSEKILDIVTNTEVIAWNQDKAGKQGYKVATFHADGTRAGVVSNHASSGKLRSDPANPQASRLRATQDKTTTTVQTQALALDFATVDGVLRGEGPLQVWKSDLYGGDIALVLFNRSPTAANITAHWSDLELKPLTSMNVRCVWWHKELGSHSISFTTAVEPRGVAAFRLSPASKNIQF